MYASPPWAPRGTTLYESQRAAYQSAQLNYAASEAIRAYSDASHAAIAAGRPLPPNPMACPTSCNCCTPERGPKCMYGTFYFLGLGFAGGGAALVTVGGGSAAAESVGYIFLAIAALDTYFLYYFEKGVTGKLSTRPAITQSNAYLILTHLLALIVNAAIISAASILIANKNDKTILAVFLFILSGLFNIGIALVHKYLVKKEAELTSLLSRPLTYSHSLIYSDSLPLSFTAQPTATRLPAAPSTTPSARSPSHTVRSNSRTTRTPGRATRVAAPVVPPPPSTQAPA